MTDRFVAVVGTVNRDVIRTSGGRTRESLGGILYNVLPLAALLEGTGITVRAIGRLGAEDHARAVELLREFPAAIASGLIVDPGGTNVSSLDYTGSGDRVESVQMRVAPLTPDDLRPIRHAEAVLVNMISGRDVERSTVETVRQGARGFFYLDVQALARTLDTPRRSRLVADGPRWARAFHVVRGNEEEIAHLGGVPSDPAAAAARLLDGGAEEVLVTRGARGAWRFTPGTSGVEREEIPAVPCGEVEDPTGCGDAFLAAAIAGRLLGLDSTSSLRLGAEVASRVATLSGLADLRRLRGIRAELTSRFPELPA